MISVLLAVLFVVSLCVFCRARSQKKVARGTALHWRFAMASRDSRFIATAIVVTAVVFIGGRFLYTRQDDDNNFSPNPMPDWEKNVKNNSRWIVVTTIQLPTKPMITLSKLVGWAVVVVGDTKTPASWSLPNCVFLSVERQKELNYRIHKLLPYRAYSRKNIGYLFAIRHGARVIYETDDDNELITNTIEEAFQVDLKHLNKDLLIYQPGPNQSTVNPYVHFGQPSVWPRGYPLSDIALSYQPVRYAKFGAGLMPLIQQGVANGDPDVDAIFRLTRKEAGKKIVIKFDPKAPPVALPPFMMTPFNSQNTLFHYQSLWGMLIPITTTFRVCDIWRGYWAQRLNWEVGGSLTFSTASVYQDRNEHDFTLDYADELDLYNQAGRLVKFLVKWRPPRTARGFFDVAIALSTDMAASGFWKSGDIDLVKAWIADLRSVGYTEPPLFNVDPAVVFAGAANFQPKKGIECK